MSRATCHMLATQVPSSLRVTRACHFFFFSLLRTARLLHDLKATMAAKRPASPETLAAPPAKRAEGDGFSPFNAAADGLRDGAAATSAAATAPAAAAGAAAEAWLPAAPPVVAAPLAAAAADGRPAFQAHAHQQAQPVQQMQQQHAEPLPQAQAAGEPEDGAAAEPQAAPGRHCTCGGCIDGILSPRNAAWLETAAELEK